MMQQASINGSGNSAKALSVIVLLAVSLLNLAGCKQKENVELQSLLDKLREETKAPGGILGVQDHEGRKVVASGYADRDTKKLLSADTPYFLGSISKTYTAVTIVRLAEEGRLSFDDKVTRFLPSFPNGERISVRQLLDQTSGLKDFYMHLYYRPDRKEMIEFVTKDWTQQELIELSGRFGLWFEPGTDWEYSSTNYFLLGVIIEKVSGLSLAEAYRNYIYHPLGINHTWITFHENVRITLPTGYMGPVEGWKHSEMFGELGATTVLDRSPVEWGAGGLAAPADDAIRFMRGLYTGKLVSKKSLDAMTTFRSTPPLGFTDAKTPSDHSDGYGLGLVRMKRNSFWLFGHGGLFTGHTAGLWQVPDCDITIALYFNRGFIEQRKLLEQILKVVTKNPDGSSRCN